MGIDYENLLQSYMEEVKNRVRINDDSLYKTADINIEERIARVCIDILKKYDELSHSK